MRVDSCVICRVDRFMAFSCFFLIFTVVAPLFPCVSLAIAVGSCSAALPHRHHGLCLQWRCGSSRSLCVQGGLASAFVGRQAAGRIARNHIPAAAAATTVRHQSAQHAADGHQHVDQATQSAPKPLAAAGVHARRGRTSRSSSSRSRRRRRRRDATDHARGRRVRRSEHEHGGGTRHTGRRR